jgi:hypothetical protein
MPWRGELLSPGPRPLSGGTLAEHARLIDAYALGALADARLTEALDAVAAAAQKVRDIAAEHDDAVGKLSARALELGAGTPGRHGVTVGPAWVAATHVVRRVRTAEALHAAIAGDMRQAREATRKVTNAQGGPVQVS